ncbi:MAG: PLDc N-terminal domain-containing protein [Bacteroidales bacterium]|nr:PLDc N-terminal domain-containing protein [Bacteroidales bacterium]
MAIIGILQIIGAIWVIISILKRPDKTTEQRLVWIIAAILFGIVTAIAYYLLEHNKLNNNNGL